MVFKLFLSIWKYMFLTQVQIESILQRECQTRATRMLHERQDCDTSEKFWFDNNTSENIFSYPYLSYIENERLQEKEQFHSKNYLLEMTLSHTKMHFKSAPQNLNFVMAKAISKIYKLHCSCNSPCTFPHNYA